MSSIHDHEEPEQGMTFPLEGSTIAAGAIRPRRVLTATVFAVYDDGHTEVHSVARGSERTKLVIDLGEESA